MYALHLGSNGISKFKSRTPVFYLQFLFIFHMNSVILIMCIYNFEDRLTTFSNNNKRINLIIQCWLIDPQQITSCSCMVDARKARKSSFCIQHLYIINEPGNHHYFYFYDALESRSKTNRDYARKENKTLLSVIKQCNNNGGCSPNGCTKKL